MKRPKHLSARQAAAALGVSKAYVCRLFSRGIIPAEKVDTDWIVAEKDIRKYQDDKRGAPLYYRDTTDWSNEDFYLMYRWLDKMVNDRKNRFDDELTSIDPTRLSFEAGAMLKATGAYKRVPNLGCLEDHPPITPPIVVSTYPCPGAFPAFEEMGIIL